MRKGTSTTLFRCFEGKVRLAIGDADFLEQAVAVGLGVEEGDFVAVGEAGEESIELVDCLFDFGFGGGELAGFVVAMTEVIVDRSD